MKYIYENIIVEGEGRGGARSKSQPLTVITNGPMIVTAVSCRV